MGSRVVTPELLDHLPPHDPEAIRSRRDLRLINSLMGNEQWICETIRRLPAGKRQSILEIGAGDGALSMRLARLFPQSTITACDLVPRPPDLAPGVKWLEGDVFAIAATDSSKNAGASPSGLLVANLFIHHFEGVLLETLGRWFERFETLVINEPDRARLPHFCGLLIHPLVNAVTRHDMHVSIRAGFTEGELTRLLGLPPARWKIRETSTWRGARRVVACRV